MRHLPRRVTVVLAVAALVTVVGLIAPAEHMSWLAPEPAAAASLPQPGKHGQTVRSLQQRLIQAELLRAWSAGTSRCTGWTPTR